MLGSASSFIHSAEARPRLDGKAGRLSVSHFTHREDPEARPRLDGKGGRLSVSHFTHLEDRPMRLVQ